MSILKMVSRSCKSTKKLLATLTMLALLLGFILPTTSLAQNSRRGSETKRNITTREKSKTNKDTDAKSKARPSYYVNQDGDTVGTPWTGSMGVTRTVADIMAEQERVGKRKTFRVRKEERERPNRKNLPQNPDAPAIAKFPDDGLPAVISRTESVAAPQTVSTNFDGATLFDTLSFPPDTMGAVGTTQFIVCVNGWMRSFNKNTGAADGALNVDMDVFFSSVRAGSSTTDPRIRYDRTSGRWFIIIINTPASGANRVLFAVSNGSTITSTSSFTFFFFQQDQVSPAGDTGFFSDYPTLGVDANALYIGVNQFNGNTFAGTTAFVVRKSSITGAGPIVASAFRGLIPAPPFGAGLYTPQGVDNFDPAATTGYFIGVDNATFSTLKMRRVTNPGTTPVLSADINLTVPTTVFPINVPHLGNTVAGSDGFLDGLDDRLFMAQIRGGSIWTCHNIQVNASGVASNSGGRNGSRWYQISNLDTTPTLTQSGTLFDNAATNPKSFWIPSINVTGQGHAALGVSSAGVADRINTATAGRLSGDALGTLQAINIFTNSTTAYNPNEGVPPGPRRWGDYSYTTVDPEDDMTLWTIQQYNQATNSYAVRVAKLLAPPPATPTSVSPSTVPAGQASVNITITGTQSTGSGFFDPGAGFTKRLAVSIPGVTVNSVTFNNPTSITANINTVGATQGQKNVTVTNPDGQALTGNNLLTIGAGGSSRAKFVDFDGDMKTDISIFRPSAGQWWFQQSSDNVVKAFTFGSSTDKLVPADYDGDGKTDIAYWNPSSGTWFVLRSSNSTFFAAPFGTNGDVPAPGYFDGDNLADFAVFRNGTWFINKTTGGVTTVPWGTTGDIPVVGDYDGDSTSDVAIFRPSGGSGSGEWWILRSTAGTFVTPFGGVGDKPVQGDYTGDGKTDVAFYRPSNNNWFVLRSEDLSFFAAPFGASGDTPTPGDYDGDGKNDLAVFRPSNTTWFVSKSTGGTLIQAFGTAGDIPVPSAFVP
jgi:hypothetical protein